MSNALSIREFYERFGQSLTLHWLDPQVGRAASLRASEVGARHVPLCGYLNVIHPPQIQIIGEAELDYLQQTEDAEIAQAMRRIETGGAAAVIVADGAQLPDSLVARLHQADIAVFTSSVSGQKLLYQLRYFLGRLLARQITVHGVFLEILSIGVLITGASGVGKSELALELISRGHRLVADDAPEFARLGPDDLNGGCPEALQDFLEVRGLGILNIRAMFGEAAIKQRKQLGLIIRLVEAPEGELADDERLTGSRSRREILEVEIPQITLPVAAGHNLAVLVETACRDHLLRQKGYASDEEFARRQEDQIAASSRPGEKAQA